MSECSKPALLCAGGMVLLNRMLMRMKVLGPIDGWRRGASLSLTRETAKFVLSAFNLRLPGDQTGSNQSADAEMRDRLLEQLEAFLRHEPQFHLLIRQETTQARVIQGDGPAFSLGIAPWQPGPERFIRPDDWSGTTRFPLPLGTSPVFEFVARIGPARELDLWLRINHVAADGVPVQEMLTRLQKQWGTAGPVLFPTPDEFAPFTGPRATPGRPGMVEVQAFIDFKPLLDWRTRQNQILPEPMTLSAAIMWWLAKHHVFRPRYLGTTVELPAIGRLSRGVGVVVSRPADYFDSPDGLSRYVRAFNRELALTRLRKSGGCKTLDAAAYLPPKLEKALMTHALNEGKSAFGSVGLTILKDAKVFGAPLGDAGHEHGFIAIGGVSLPSANGPVGCVVVKGPANQIAQYATTIREAITMSANGNASRCAAN